MARPARKLREFPADLHFAVEPISFGDRRIPQAYTDPVSTIDIASLSPAQRLELLEQIWDSLSPETIPLTQAQREELDRRLDELDREGPVGIPWDETLDRIRNRGR